MLSKTPLEDVRRGLPGDDGDEQARYIEAVVSATAARCASPRSTCPTAIRSAPRSSPTSCAWMDAAARPRRELLPLEEPFVLARRLQRHPDAERRRRARATGRATPCSSRRAAPRCRALQNLGLTDAYARPTERPAPTPSGTIRPAPGSGTTASASTTSCSRRRPPTGSACRDPPPRARLGQAVRPRAGDGDPRRGLKRVPFARRRATLVPWSLEFHHRLRPPRSERGERASAPAHGAAAAMVAGQLACAADPLELRPAGFQRGRPRRPRLPAHGRRLARRDLHPRLQHDELGVRQRKLPWRDGAGAAACVAVSRASATAFQAPPKFRIGSLRSTE